MNNTEYLDKITLALKELEEDGDIVITTTSPERVSERLFHTVFEALLENTEGSDALIECNIPYLLRRIAARLTEVFGVNQEDAKKITDEYYHRLLSRLSMQQAAELISHEGPLEMALLSYYCVQLDKNDSRDCEYLDWRKSYYAKRNA